ncbi:MAG: ABC transporter permease [Helicobacteraceae bacterium]|jgi:sulfonate transport system permease protein|nr:ABC transporter permease [Helicobacteraceae bacterium]
MLRRAGLAAQYLIPTALIIIAILQIRQPNTTYHVLSIVLLLTLIASWKITGILDWSRRFTINLVLYLVLPIALIAIWKIADIVGWIQPYTMPPPEDVLMTGVEFIKDGTLYQHTKASIIRVLEGFAIALVLALTLGIAIGLSPQVDRLTKAIIQVVQPIPPIAWIPLAILWFGIGEGSKIYIIAIGAFFPILINTIEGIRNIDPKFLELAKVYETSRRRVIARIILPGAAPFIMAGVRLGLSMAWICVVAAELIAAQAGIGYMLMDGRSLARPDMVILGMLIIGVVGKALDDLLRKITKKAIKWQ